MKKTLLSILLAGTVLVIVWTLRGVDKPIVSSLLNYLDNLRYNDLMSTLADSFNSVISSYRQINFASYEFGSITRAILQTLSLPIDITIDFAQWFVQVFNIATDIVFGRL